MEPAGPVGKGRPGVDMEAGSGEVSHTYCAPGCHNYSLPEEAHRRTEHSGPEVAARTLGSLAVRRAAAGRTKLGGREGRVRRCADRHLPGRRDSDCHFGEEAAWCLGFRLDSKRFSNCSRHGGE